MLEFWHQIQSIQLGKVIHLSHEIEGSPTEIAVAVPEVQISVLKICLGGLVIAYRMWR
jgi:hypothetical protein